MLCIAAFCSHSYAVCQSVRLSRDGIAAKQIQLRSRGFHRRIVPSS